MTEYIIHYNNTDSSGSADMITGILASSTSTNVIGLTDGDTYNISVEATSDHLSGESDEMTITLGISQPHLDYNYLLCFLLSQGHLQLLQKVWRLYQGLPQSQCPGRQWLMLTDILSHSHVQQEQSN